MFKRLFLKNVLFVSTIFISMIFVSTSTVVLADETVQLNEGQWSVEQANDWYAKQQWIIGCNFLPSTAINDVEMWQDKTFDLETIDKEFGLAKEWGINSVRVFLNYVVWEAEAEKLKSNFKKFLDVAEKHGISVMPILFDDCNFSGNIAKVGKQQNPVPGVHNSGWVSSPPAAMVRNESQWNKLKDYEQDMIRTFGSDKRIIIWDLYNEPSNSDSRIKPQLLKNIFAWAREVKPSQPLTVGVWNNFSGELSKLMRNHSDIVSFHAYDRKDGVEEKINWAQELGRPVVCTEWLLRQSQNTPKIILPLFKDKKIGGYNWGLVAGRTQTYFHWGSRKGMPEPSVWQHDLIRENGTPYSLTELLFYRKISGQFGDNETVLLPTSESEPRAWKYTESDMSGKNWYANDFNDSSWSNGNAPFGKNEPNINRKPNTNWTGKEIYLRQKFRLTEEQLKEADNFYLLLHFDEDAVVYINGVKVAEVKGYNAEYEGVEISAEAGKLLVAGDNQIAVSCKNSAGGQFIDCGLYAVKKTNKKTDKKTVAENLKSVIIHNHANNNIVFAR